MRRTTSVTGLLLLALGAVSGTALGQTAPAAKPQAPKVQTKESQAALTPASALEKLKKGNARFVERNMRARDWQAKVSATASGQYPFAVVLGCMDSRTPIEIVFDQGIGDVFGIRIAGNIVNEDELGSMEYATKVVGSKLLLVLGHTSCGAVKGAIDDAKLGNLTGLLARIRREVAGSPEVQSRKSAPDRRPARRPSGPSSSAATSRDVGRQVTTTSTTAASSRGVAAAVAPYRAAKSVARAAVRFQTTRSPRRARCTAIGVPMAPRPRKPTRMADQVPVAA